MRQAYHASLPFSFPQQRCLPFVGRVGMCRADCEGLAAALPAAWATGRTPAGPPLWQFKFGQADSCCVSRWFGCAKFLVRLNLHARCCGLLCLLIVRKLREEGCRQLPAMPGLGQSPGVPCRQPSWVGHPGPPLPPTLPHTECRTCFSKLHGTALSSTLPIVVWCVSCCRRHRPGLACPQAQGPSRSSHFFFFLATNPQAFKPSRLQSRYPPPHPTP